MVLDFLPYKQPKKSRKKKLGVLRYVMFALSLVVVFGLFLMKIANLERIMFWMFLGGNAFYYIVGIVLAFAFKDNRAFCKYLCPLGAFYALFNKFSLYRLTVDQDQCVNCKACERACKMGVEVTKDINSPECIRCGACMDACPKNCIHREKLITKGDGNDEKMYSSSVK